MESLKRRKQQAVELIQQIEGCREEYKETGWSLTRYTPVLLDRGTTERYLFESCLGMLVLGGLYGTFRLTRVESVLLGKVVFLIGIAMGVVAAICFVVLIVLALYWAFRSLVRDHDQKEISWWRKADIMRLQRELDDVRSAIEKRSKKMEEARPWIEQIKRLEPIITNELHYGLNIVTSHNEYRAEVTYDCNDRQMVLGSYGLTKRGYEDLVCWIFDERKERGERKEKVQEVENTL